VDDAPSSIGGYRVVRELGRGGMGVVYEVARDAHERFAIKVMLDGFDRPDLHERFRREARAAALIGSEHVVRIFETGLAVELDGTPFLVMELLRGATTKDIVAAHGAFPPADVCRIVWQCAHALDRAHAAGYVHRDLKPDNVFLHTKDDGERIAKVLDFGVALVLDEDATAITATGATIGSLHYMAPEQTRSEKGATGATADVWAMGMIAIELLTGERYWGSAKPSRMLEMLVEGPKTLPSRRWPALPPAVDTWFFRSCAMDPAARFGSMGEQAAALTHACGFGGRPTPPP
jgi:serine/threonine-protein kinase